MSWTTVNSGGLETNPLPASSWRYKAENGLDLFPPGRRLFCTTNAVQGISSARLDKKRNKRV